MTSVGAIKEYLDTFHKKLKTYTRYSGVCNKLKLHLYYFLKKVKKFENPLCRRKQTKVKKEDIELNVCFK